jgi:hypothetical protein
MGNWINKTKYSIGDKIIFNCKYKNEFISGEIVDIRPSNLNWDYKIRYQVYTDFEYIQWVSEEDMIERSKK